MDSVFSEASSVEISKLLILVPQGAEYQAVVGITQNNPHFPTLPLFLAAFLDLLSDGQF